MNRVVFGAGRIGRLEYLAWSVGLGVAYVVLLVMTSDGDLVARDGNDVGNRFLFSVPLIWLQYAQAVRRAHDRSHSGWFVVLYFIPLVNLGAWAYLQFIGSDQRENTWGPPAERRSLSADELAQAKAILVQQEADHRAYVEKDLLNHDGSFDMDGLFKSNPALGGSAGETEASPSTSTLPPPPSAPPPPPPPPPAR